MLVEAQGVSVALGGRPVLDGETVRCTPGIMTALVGPSGCGKTTLLHCLGLLLPVDQGRILIDGNNVTRYSAAARRRFWRDHAAFALWYYPILEQFGLFFFCFLLCYSSGPLHFVPYCHVANPWD